MKLKNMPIVATLIALTCVTIMTGLGLWQLDRKQQKQSRLAQLQERKENSPFTLNEILAIGTDNQDFPIYVAGELMSQQLFLIDNKIHQGKVGFDVIVPLRTENGILLLNHGWVQGVGSRTLLPTISVQNQNEYVGMVYYPSNNKMINETNRDENTFPALLQQTDIAIIQGYFSEPVLPFVINLDADPTSGFVREWKPVVMSPEKHLGYAIQWFGLAVACLTVYLLSVIKISQSSQVNPKVSE